MTFFATNHANGLWDGIAGIVKCLVARPSLQNTHTLSFRKMFDWCAKNIEGITFLFNSSKNVGEIVVTCELEKRYGNYFNKFQDSRTNHFSISKENKMLKETIFKDMNLLEVLLWNSIPGSSY